MTEETIWNEADIDPAFAERDRCRKAGRPVEIAKTERLLIRETIMEDVPKLYEIRQRTGMGGHTEPACPTLKEEMEFMEAYIRHMYAFYDFGLWTVLERENGRIAGRAGLFPSKILDEGVEMGYMIAPDFRRRGYGTECCRAILAYAFQVLDLPDIHVLIDVRNRASVRTVGKIGFIEREKIRIGQTEYLHGYYHADMYKISQL